MMATEIAGAPDMYAERGPTASVNFITCHDGFTLADLVAYSEKHNRANGEQNRDGANDNNSWNWGHEGPTGNPQINALRRRVMKNALAVLLVSQGIPMLLMGDEMAHSKNGNNNTYAQDNDLNWLNWDLLDRNSAHFHFVRQLIAFRKAHPALRRRYHLKGVDLLDRRLYLRRHEHALGTAHLRTAPPATRDALASLRRHRPEHAARHRCAGP